VILVDTSVWADHLRREDATMAALLDAGHVLTHPFVIGELALGNLPQREHVISDLQALPQVNLATDDEVLHLIHRHSLSGLGIGYIDAHLVAAVQLSDDASFWTRDKRLAAVADRLAITRIILS
jgi:predicted nucleic acid-binding protein